MMEYAGRSQVLSDGPFIGVGYGPGSAEHQLGIIIPDAELVLPSNCRAASANLKGKTACHKGHRERR